MCWKYECPVLALCNFDNVCRSFVHRLIALFAPRLKLIQSLCRGFALSLFLVLFSVPQRSSTHHTGADSIFISRDKLEELPPGLYLATVHGFAERNNYRLTIEKSFLARKPPSDEQAALEAIYMNCCNNRGACWLIQPSLLAAAAPGVSEEELQNFCHMDDQACDENGHVVALRLPSQNMECEFPTELANLKHLRRLDLEDNYIYGNLSHVFSVLQELPLQSFHFAHNELRDRAACFPRGGELAKELTYLDLAYNWMDGELPGCIFDSEVVEILTLQGNAFHGEFPKTLPPAAALRHVDISWQGLDEKYLHGTASDFTMWPSLEYLNLAENRLGGPFPKFPRSMKALWLDENKISGPLPVDLAQALPKLELMQLNHNGFSGPLPLAIPSSLEQLDVSENNLSGQIPWSSWISSHEKSRLQIIRMGGNQLSGSLPAAAAMLPMLWSLNLTDNRVSGALDEFADALPKDSAILQFELGFNKIEGAVPKGLTNLAVLRKELGAHGALTAMPTFDIAFNMLTGPYPIDIAVDASNEWTNMFFDVSGNRFACPTEYLSLDTKDAGVRMLLEHEKCFDRRGSLVALGVDQEKQRSREATEALAEQWDDSALINGGSKFGAASDLGGRP